MPKLNDTHLPDRLRRRIAELEAGEEVDKKDIRAVLTPEQIKQLDEDWAAQKILRSGKRATTALQKKQLGWKTLGEVRLEVLRAALKAAERNQVNAHTDRQRHQEIRQMRIYMDTYSAAIDAGNTQQQAKNQANNALTRAELRRLDGQSVGTMGLSKRDKEIQQMEYELKQRMASEMTAEELEQKQLLTEHEAALANKRKK